MTRTEGCCSSTVIRALLTPDISSMLNYGEHRFQDHIINYRELILLQTQKAINLYYFIKELLHCKNLHGLLFNSLSQ